MFTYLGLGQAESRRLDISVALPHGRHALPAASHPQEATLVLEQMEHEESTVIPNLGVVSGDPTTSPHTCPTFYLFHVLIGKSVITYVVYITHLWYRID